MKYTVLVALPNRDTQQFELECHKDSDSFCGGYIGGFFTFRLITGESVHINMQSVIQITEEKL